MAKIKKKIQTLSGKLGDVVYVNSPTYGSYARKTIEPGTKKNEPGLKTQYIRTKLLNGIASNVNRIVKCYAENFKHRKFYAWVQSLIRHATADSRFILLKQLKGLDVNRDYPFNNLGDIHYSSAYTKKSLSIELATATRPIAGAFQADSYSYAVIVMMWDKGTDKVKDQCQLSEWVSIKDKKPVFEFVFERPAGSVHWLLCVQILLGKNEKRIEHMKAEGMQIVDAGSFDKKDIALLEKLNKIEVIKNKKAVKEEVVRVKRKG